MTDTQTKFYDEELLTVSSKDLVNLKISDTHKDSLIEIADVDDKGIFHIKMEGQFGWENDQFCAFISHDWYRKWWELPLGLPFHMDLMRRLADFKSGTEDNIRDIDFQDDGDWCHLNYTIEVPQDRETLQDAFDFVNETIQWIDEMVQTAQEGVASFITELTTKYNELSLVKLPELIEKIDSATDRDEKGKLLEEFVARLFESIDGIRIIERKRTKTEEIDIVLVNNATEGLWKDESKLILIECKNWTKRPAGKNEYVAFREKLVNRRGRAKLGLFISGKGFAKTFQLEDLRNSKDDILIIPIDLKQLIEVVDKSLDLTEELEKLYVEATTK